MPFFARSPLRRLGADRDAARRRDDADGDRAVTFELEEYEFVPAGEAVGLLRVAGRWVADVNRTVGEVVLAMSRGAAAEELAPLPDPNDSLPLASPPGEPWRAAFMVSPEAVEDPRLELSLVAAGETRVALPRPGEWDPSSWDPAAAADVVPAEPEVEEPEPDEPEPDPESLPPAAELDATPTAEVLHQELDRLRGELQAARTEVVRSRTEAQGERRRREALEEELRSRLDVERRARQAAEPREVRPPLDDELLGRLERARRMSDTVS
jgi:hypothetical protein